MNKITCALLGSAAVLTSGFANAGAAPSSATGAYVLAAFGMGNTNAKYNAQNGTQFSSNVYEVNAVGAPTAFPNTIMKGYGRNINIESGKFNPKFGIGAGYGMQMGQGYFGLELAFDVDSAKVSPLTDNSDGKGTANVYTVGAQLAQIVDAEGNETSADEAATYYAQANPQALWKATVKRRYGAEIAFKGGFFVSPSVLAYVRLGLSYGSWKAQVDASNMAVLPTIASISTFTLAGSGFQAGAVAATSNVATQPTVNKTKSAISFAPGLGMQVFVNKNFFVGTEWKYIFGPTIKLTQNIDGLAAIQGTSLSHSFKTSQNVFSIFAGWKF